MGSFEVGHNALGRPGRSSTEGASWCRGIRLRPSSRARVSEIATRWSGRRPAPDRPVRPTATASSHTRSHLKGDDRRRQEGAASASRGPACSTAATVGRPAALDFRCLRALAAGVDPTYGICSGGGRIRSTMDRSEAELVEMVERGLATRTCSRSAGSPRRARRVKGLRTAHPGVIDQDLRRCGRSGGNLSRDRRRRFGVSFNFPAIARSRSPRLHSGDAKGVPFDRKRQPQVCFAGMMTTTATPTCRAHLSPPGHRSPPREYLGGQRRRQLACSETAEVRPCHLLLETATAAATSMPPRRSTFEVPSDRVSFTSGVDEAAEITDAGDRRLRARPYGLRTPELRQRRHGRTYGISPPRLAVSRRSGPRPAAAGDPQPAAWRWSPLHGNSRRDVPRSTRRDRSRSRTGRPQCKTSHTLNPVQAIIYDPGFQANTASIPASPTGLAMSPHLPGADGLPAAGSTGEHGDLQRARTAKTNLSKFGRERSRLRDRRQLV